MALNNTNTNKTLMPRLPSIAHMFSSFPPVSRKRSNPPPPSTLHKPNTRILQTSSDHAAISNPNSLPYFPKHPSTPHADREEPIYDRPSASSLVHPSTPCISKKLRRSTSRSRRSSLASRGSRVRTSLVPLYPHASIHPAIYSRHLPDDLVPIKRMRLLFLWCTRHSAESILQSDFDFDKVTLPMNATVSFGSHSNLVSVPPTHPNILQAVAIIARSAMAKLVKKEINLDWSDKSLVPICPPSPVRYRTQPNPVNDRMRRDIQQHQFEISILNTEKDNWTSVHIHEMQSHAKLIDASHTQHPDFTNEELSEVVTREELDMARPITDLDKSLHTEELGRAMDQYAGIAQVLYRLGVAAEVAAESRIRQRVDLGRAIEHAFPVTPSHLGLHILSAFQQSARQQ